MTTEDRIIAELARLQAPKSASHDGSPYTHLVQGVVVGVQLGSLDVHLRGQVNATPNVRYLKSYVPGFGDNVWCLRFGTDIICLGDLETRPEAGGGTTIEPWHEVGTAGEPAFNNSWVNWGAPYDTCAFAMGSDGWIRMKGLVKLGSPLAGSVFNLPLEYRPPFLWGANQLCNDVLTTINVNSATGSVTNAGGMGTNAYMSLSGITWPSVEAWERERDTSWFPLVRSLNGWYADENDINVFPMIYRRGDGWRYLKGNIQGGTATAGVIIPFTHMMPEDATSSGDMLLGRDSTTNALTRLDLRGTRGEMCRVTGSTAVQILVNAMFWSRWGENFFGVDPTYPNKHMQNWLKVADTASLGFLNGWRNRSILGGSSVEWRNFNFMKDDFGMVHLRGFLDGQLKTSNIVTTMPDGYRPAADQIFPAVKFDAGGGIAGRVNVKSSGDIEFPMAVANWHSLQGYYQPVEVAA